MKEIDVEVWSATPNSVEYWEMEQGESFSIIPRESSGVVIRVNSLKAVGSRGSNLRVTAIGSFRFRGENFFSNEWTKPKVLTMPGCEVKAKRPPDLTSREKNDFS